MRLIGEVEGEAQSQASSIQTWAVNTRRVGCVKQRTTKEGYDHDGLFIFGCIACRKEGKIG